jgi:diguanylate cyclase (GGDEF)-like protein
MSMVCVPLRHGDRVVGVLKVYDPEPHAFGPVDVEVLRLLSGVIASHLAHASDFEAQQHESRHDALTGLPNWRAFEERLAAEISRARRHGDRLALCVFDLDGFKQINDTEGHGAGNDVLKAVAAHLTSGRAEDVGFRVGGDEFALLLVGADEAAARCIADRLAERLRNDATCRGVGMSCGVTALSGSDDRASLVARADAAMYEVKRARSRTGNR